MATPQCRNLLLVCLALLPRLLPAQSKNEIDFISDTQQPMSIEELVLHPAHNVKATAALLADILKQRPLSVYMLGDVVSVGSSNRKWRAVDRFLANCRMNNIAVHGLLGNHDVLWSRRRGERNFRLRFPDNVDVGYVSIIDSIAVVMLNSNFNKLTAVEIDKQQRWYSATLAQLNANDSIRTIIVTCHHAPYSNSRIVGSSRLVRRYFVPAFLQTAKCSLFITGHAHAFEHFRYSGKDFLVIGGGGGLHQPLDTSAKRLPDIAFGYKPMFHYLSVQWMGHELLVTSRFLKPDFSGVEAGYSFRIGH